MKNNDLHNVLKAMDITPVRTPQHQRALKYALLNYQAPKQTLVARFRATYKNILGVPMTHKRTFFGASSLALVVVFALSILIYNYNYSPRAEAEQLVNQSIGKVMMFNSGQMSQIQSQLGGDPVAALKEAQAAKDLTILTPDGFKAESAKHKGVATSSLGKDGPQYNSVGISANGGLPSTPPAGGGVHYSTNGPVSGDTKSGAATSVQTENSSGPSNTQSGPVNFTPATPSKYLRYTNSSGHVVVLGLDDKGVPINKTVFMTDAEVQNMQQ